ncbi:hypothetical protein DK427_14130 [Methylobacterium radiodurans]|uniref:Uncharacterized protein n=1 Tax=Methylobacterium radiodurans TaxID=2202828 RepID=A0A2U8VTM4_9HYPH|nr:hypothetical protein DK427_14130 [Methylobacterium radiodurans]
MLAGRRSALRSRSPARSTDGRGAALIRSAPPTAGALRRPDEPRGSMHRSMHRLDVVDFLKQGGRDFQARMNAVLRRDMEAETERTP